MKKHPHSSPITAALKSEILALSKAIPEEVLDKKSALWLGFILHVGFEAGLRKREINEARLDWFDLHERRITVLPDSRGSSSRTIPMTDVLFEFLTDYPMTEDGLPKPDSASEDELLRHNYSRLLRPFTQWAGTVLKCDLSHVHASSMRSTYARLLINENVSVTQVAEWMGCPDELVREYTQGQQA